MEVIEKLMIFGLTRQEATIYMALFQEGELNGYEVSKLTGISRSNAYSALAGLVEKGAAYIIEGDAVKYTPVSIEEFCNNKINFMKESGEKLINIIPKKKVKTDGYITIKGEMHIMNKLKNMLVGAKERVYLSVCNEILKKVSKELKELSNKGIKVVIITDLSFNMEKVKIYYDEKKAEQIRLIVDSKHVLTGEIADKVNSTCLYSSNNNLVEVFKEALANEIKLIEIRRK